MSKVCAYCGQAAEVSPCPHCGGNAVDKPKPKEWCWRVPVFHNGYIIWALTEGFWDYDTITYYFYLGEMLVESIVITRGLVREFVPEGEDIMPFLFNLLEVAQGREEVMRIETLNKRKHAAFEVRRVQTEREDEYARLRSLPEHEMFQEIMRRR